MVSKLNNIINRAYREFVPKKANELKVTKIAGKIRSYLDSSLKRLGISAEIKFGGSYAKNTWINKESDIDIFVIFNSEAETKLLKRLVPKSFMEAHGSRLYFRGKISGITIEVVPLVKFTDRSKVENSIDLSILHERYIREKLGDDLRKDVIILKRFCKANDCYGSETYKHGFSGYALELLVINYGGLVPLLKAVDYWYQDMVIDIGGHYKSEAQARSAIGKQEAPMVLIDPTNPKRNICGSLNQDNFVKFIFACKRFLVFPSFSMFQNHDMEKEIKNLSKARRSKLFVYETKILEPRDTFLSKYNKALDRLLRELSANDVEIYSCNVDYGTSKAKLFLEIKNIPSTAARPVSGPKVWLESKKLGDFLKVHNEVYLRGDSLYYDKKYGIKNFNIAIKTSIVKYMSEKAVLKI